METNNTFPLFLLGDQMLLLPIRFQLSLSTIFFLAWGEFQTFTHHCYLIFFFCTFPNSLEYFLRWNSLRNHHYVIFYASLYRNMKIVSIPFLIIPSMKSAFFTAVTHGSWHTIPILLMFEICLRVETLDSYFPCFPHFTYFLPSNCRTKQLLFVFASVVVVFCPVLWRKIIIFWALREHLHARKVRLKLTVLCMLAKSPWYPHHFLNLFCWLI